jgi:hypothetical protein
LKFIAPVILNSFQHDNNGFQEVRDKFSEYNILRIYRVVDVRISREHAGID